MSNPKDRLKTIYIKINFIETICEEDGSITTALNDEKRSRASILMHLTSYDSVDDEILEAVLRVHIPKIKIQIEDILQ